MKQNIYFILLFISMSFSAQNTSVCNLQKSDTSEALMIVKNDLICLAKNSDKPYTIFYTLASWCAPCRLHFPDAVELEKTGKVNLFVVL